MRLLPVHATLYSQSMAVLIARASSVEIWSLIWYLVFRQPTWLPSDIYWDMAYVFILLAPLCSKCNPDVEIRFVTIKFEPREISRMDLSDEKGDRKTDKFGSPDSF